MDNIIQEFSSLKINLKDKFKGINRNLQNEN